MFNLKGRVAVVTGASSGLGVNMAKALAAQGADLAILARRTDRLESVKKEIEAYGVRCISVTCDVSKEDSVVAAAETVLKEFGRVDILVNNAGVATSVPMETMTLEEWNRDIGIDATGVFLVAREFGKNMIKNRYGRIINIASVYGLVGNAVLPAGAYHTAKGAVVNFTRAAAAEWAKYNVNVNCICPGYFNTEMTESVIDTDVFTAYMKNSVPMGRYGRGEEIEAAAVFLASDEASYTTGAIVPVDGGYTCI